MHKLHLWPVVKRACLFVIKEEQKKRCRINGEAGRVNATVSDYRVLLTTTDHRWPVLTNVTGHSTRPVPQPVQEDKQFCPQLPLTTQKFHSFLWFVYPICPLIPTRPPTFTNHPKYRAFLAWLQISYVQLPCLVILANCQKNIRSVLSYVWHLYEVWHFITYQWYIYLNIWSPYKKQNKLWTWFYFLVSHDNINKKV